GLRPSARRDRAERAQRPPDRRTRGGPSRGDPAGPRRRRPRDRPRAGRAVSRRCRAALAGLRELRPVPRLRGARRGLQEAGAEPVRVRRGLESSVLILVTLGLVAFGLVMVY